MKDDVTEAIETLRKWGLTGASKALQSEFERMRSQLLEREEEVNGLEEEIVRLLGLNQIHRDVESLCVSCALKEKLDALPRDRTLEIFVVQGAWRVAVYTEAEHAPGFRLARSADTPTAALSDALDALAERLKPKPPLGYRLKDPKPIQAEQWLVPGDHPEVIVYTDFKWLRNSTGRTMPAALPREHRGCPTNKCKHLLEEHGVLNDSTVCPGDWIVPTVAGPQVWSDVEFKKNFEAVSEEGN